MSLIIQNCCKRRQCFFSAIDWRSFSPPSFFPAPASSSWQLKCLLGLLLPPKIGKHMELHGNIIFESGSHCSFGSQVVPQNPLAIIQMKVTIKCFFSSGQPQNARGKKTLPLSAPAGLVGACPSHKYRCHSNNTMYIHNYMLITYHKMIPKNMWIPYNHAPFFFADWFNMLGESSERWATGATGAQARAEHPPSPSYPSPWWHGQAWDLEIILTRRSYEKIWQVSRWFEKMWKDVGCLSQSSQMSLVCCAKWTISNKSKAKLQGNEESKGPNEPPKSRVPSWGWQTVEAFVIRSWAKRAASSYFGETHLIFPMAENKIWGLPCAVLPKKCPIRISRKSFLSQLFNKACSIWVHVIPKGCLTKMQRFSTPQSTPAKVDLF